MILHDWPTPVARTILEHLRKAATKNTRLVVGDFIQSFACPAGDIQAVSLTEDIASDDSVEVPYPLLSNMGKASSLTYSLDIMV
jgi:hypothetical protein